MLPSDEIECAYERVDEFAERGERRERDEYVYRERKEGDWDASLRGRDREEDLSE